jgi:cell division control protein 6
LAELSNGILTPTSSPLKAQLERISRPNIETAPRASIQHVARLAASIFSHSAASRLSGLNLQQKAVLCSLVVTEQRQNSRGAFSTPSKSVNRIPDVKELYEKYRRMCQNGDGILPVLKNTEFRDVVASLETLGLIHEAIGRGSSMLTPSKTPTRNGKNIDERRFASAVSESEMRESLQGPGADLLRRFMVD